MASSPRRPIDIPITVSRLAKALNQEPAKLQYLSQDTLARACKEAGFDLVETAAVESYVGAVKAQKVTLDEVAERAGELKLYNVLGEEIHSQKIVNRTSYIVNQSYAPGIYFYKVISKDGASWSGKVVVE